MWLKFLDAIPEFCKHTSIFSFSSSSTLRSAKFICLFSFNNLRIFRVCMYDPPQIQEFSFSIHSIYINDTSWMASYAILPSLSSWIMDDWKQYFYIPDVNKKLRRTISQLASFCHRVLQLWMIASKKFTFLKWQDSENSTSSMAWFRFRYYLMVDDWNRNIGFTECQPLLCRIGIRPMAWLPFCYCLIMHDWNQNLGFT